MRTALLILGAASASFYPSAAGAQAPVAESRLIATFTAICLEHMGDAETQRTTAVAAPWNFAPGGPVTDPRITSYQSGSIRLGISDAMGTCTLTGGLEPQVTLASFQAVMAAAIGTDEGRPLREADSRYWIIADDHSQEHVLALKVSNESGRNLATLWVQRRAAVLPQNQ